MDKVKIGAVQHDIKPLDIEHNFKHAVEYIKKAHKQDCQFVSFSELFLTGRGILSELEKSVSVKLSNFRQVGITPVLKYSDTIPGRYTEKFSKLAEEYSIHIVMGSIIERVGDVFYNTSVLIDESGNIVGKYRKYKLWLNERNYIKAGETLPIFNTKYGKVGLMTSCDMVFPEVASKLEQKGAKILFIQGCTSLEDKYGLLTDEELLQKVPKIDTISNILDATVQVRATDNNIAVVYTNSVGILKLAHKTFNYLGRTQVAVPFFGNIGNMEKKEGLLTAEIHLDLIDLANKAYCSLKNEIL